jgi:hypothetical protein
MEKIFHKMSKTKDVKEFLFLCPWELLVGGIDDSSGGEAKPGTGRWWAASIIAKELEMEFGVTYNSKLVAEYEKRK